MKGLWTKFATAAAVIAATLIGIYALTGSIDGSSITLAQVQQAMDNVDWMQIVNTSKGKPGEQADWYSFATKVHIAVVPGIGIRYSDYKAGIDLFWPEKSESIHQSSLKAKPFANGAGDPFEFISRSLRLTTGQEGAILKEPGTFKDQKVEVWTVHQDKQDTAQILTVYMDLNSKRPIAATYQRTRGTETGAEDNTILFQYPRTGPADIYAAGVSSSATIKPVNNQ